MPRKTLQAFLRGDTTISRLKINRTVLTQTRLLNYDVNYNPTANINKVTKYIHTKKREGNQNSTLQISNTKSSNGGIDEQKV